MHNLVDRLGSPSTLIKGSTSSPIVIRHRAHGIFGRPIDAGTGSIMASLSSWDGNYRGYTGHEQLVEQELVHMNGRIYDYNLGRFMSVDPFIQMPQSSQSINLYSYIMNNPMAGTDPTGYQSQDVDNTAQYKATDIEIANNISVECAGENDGCSPPVKNGGDNKEEASKPKENIGKKVERLNITCDSKCQAQAKKEANFQKMLAKWKLKAMQENQTNWVRGPTGHQQIRRAAVDELLYGKGAQLSDNQCGMATILI